MPTDKMNGRRTRATGPTKRSKAASMTFMPLAIKALARLLYPPLETKEPVTTFQDKRQQERYLAGETGPIGPTGASGTIGIDGQTGPTGNTGSNGSIETYYNGTKKYIPVYDATV